MRKRQEIEFNRRILVGDKRCVATSRTTNTIYNRHRFMHLSVSHWREYMLLVIRHSSHQCLRDATTILEISLYITGDTSQVIRILPSSNLLLIEFFHLFPYQIVPVRLL